MRLRVAAARDGVAAVPVDQLVAAVTALGLEVRAPGAAAGWGDLARLLPFAPVVDGELLPRRPLLIGAHPSAAVEENMHSTWVRFAASGDPGWAPGPTVRLADKLAIVR